MNKLVLEAVVAEIQPLRYTPAGLPLLSIVLQHRSEQIEAGLKRKIDCELHAVLMGALAKTDFVKLGTNIKVAGFLAKRSLKSTQLVLHINQIKQL